MDFNVSFGVFGKCHFVTGLWTPYCRNMFESIKNTKSIQNMLCLETRESKTSVFLFFKCVHRVVLENLKYVLKFLKFWNLQNVLFNLDIFKLCHFDFFESRNLGKLKLWSLEICWIHNTYHIQTNNSSINRLSMVDGPWFMAQGSLAGPRGRRGEGGGGGWEGRAAALGPRLDSLELWAMNH